MMKHLEHPFCFDVIVALDGWVHVCEAVPITRGHQQESLCYLSSTEARKGVGEAP